MKDVQEPESEALLWGNRLHKALDLHFRQAAPLPPELKLDRAVELARRIAALPGMAGFESERELALTREGATVQWRSPSAWLRVKLDVLFRAADGQAAVVLDWKTGRSRDEAQLAVYALALFDAEPSLRRVRTAFVSVPSAEVTADVTWDRSAFADRRLELAERVARMEAAFAAGESGHPPMPSGLCRAHCPVLSCPYNGRS